MVALDRWVADADEGSEPESVDSAPSCEALGTHGPEGCAICATCEQLATFLYLDDLRGQVRGVCSRCGADWWI
jgi:hypothetical protein